MLALKLWLLDNFPCPWGSSYGQVHSLAEQWRGSGSVRFDVTYLCNALEFWQVTLCIYVVIYKMGTKVESW